MSGSFAAARSAVDEDEGAAAVAAAFGLLGCLLLFGLEILPAGGRRDRVEDDDERRHDRVENSEPAHRQPPPAHAPVGLTLLFRQRLVSKDFCTSQVISGMMARRTRAMSACH